MPRVIFYFLPRGSRLGLRLVCLAFLFGIMGVREVAAQQDERIRVKVGDNIESHEYASAAYRYPAFKESIIYYTTGGLARGKLNYHQLLGEMHFIDPKGDTLALDNLYLVKYLTIGETKFYYDPEKKGFAEEIADFNQVKLLLKHSFKPSDREKGVAYGQYSNTSATKNYGTFTVNGQMQRLSPNEYLVYAKMANYLISDQNNKFYPANKAAVLKIFYRNKPAVEKFIKENRIDFQKEADLKRLLSYCTQLT